MSVTNDELQSFRRFADEKLRTGGAESLEELVELWRAEHPAPNKKAGSKAEADSAVAAKRKTVPYL